MIMSTSKALQSSLALYLVIGGLALSVCDINSSIQNCDINSIVQDLSSNGSFKCNNICSLCEQSTEATAEDCAICQYDCSNNTSVVIITIKKTGSQDEGPTVEQTTFIATVAILAVLLGIVIICWTVTYRAMKKRIKSNGTLTTANTSNSLTADTNNRELDRQLCFQNASYEHSCNSPSFSQSPVPECTNSNIYDLPFQTPAEVSKEKPKSQEAQLPKGSIRYTANRHRSVGENKNVCQSAPESPRVNKSFEYSNSGNEQQWVAVTEYEVPVAQQEA